MIPNYRLTRIACYMGNISMSAVANLTPLLFLTFRELYGISYTLLGLLVTVNFLTQLTIDMIFSLFSHRFNIPFVVRMTPWITVTGLVIFAVMPMLFPGAAYAFIVVGTLIFSSSAGLSEVLISPVVAAIPSDNPSRDMSMLHSIYAWGVVGVAIITTLLLRLVGHEHWQYVALMWCVVPVCGGILFACAPLPPLETPKRTSGAVGMFKNRWVMLCVLSIFCGGAAENTISQWCSSYIESALGVSKTYGDIFGVAGFAFMLGLGRTLYAKLGRRIYPVVLWGFSGAVVCYLTAALTPVPLLGLVACGLTGLCVSMLWPGSLLMLADGMTSADVAAYALMAAGGDFGSSVGPQMVGVVTDVVVGSEFAAGLTQSWGIGADQLGMKTGLLCGALFPAVGIVIAALLMRGSGCLRGATPETAKNTEITETK